MCAQLFGRQNPDSHLWVDGLVSKWLRDSTLTCDTMAELLTSQSSEKQRFARMMGSLSHVKKWLVLDGPMDDTWLENMGTLLDSTRALSLPNGESIVQPGEIITRTVGFLVTESRITVSIVVFHHRCFFGYLAFLYGYKDNSNLLCFPMSCRNVDCFLVWLKILLPVLRSVRYIFEDIFVKPIFCVLNIRRLLSIFMKATT